MNPWVALWAHENRLNKPSLSVRIMNMSSLKHSFQHKVSIVIPVYNGANTIEPIVRQLEADFDADAMAFVQSGQDANANQSEQNQSADQQSANGLKTKVHRSLLPISATMAVPESLSVSM